MSEMSDEQVSVDKEDIEFDQSELRQIRERVLEAEKEKLNLDNPMGVVNDIEDIIREEVT